MEEHEKIVQDQPGEIRQEKTVVVSQDEEGIKRDMKSAQISKPTRKSTAPRFVSPITGMIVDQGTDIILEGIIDGKIIKYGNTFEVHGTRRVDSGKQYIFSFLIRA